MCCVGSHISNLQQVAGSQFRLKVKRKMLTYFGPEIGRQSIDRRFRTRGVGNEHRKGITRGKGLRERGLKCCFSISWPNVHPSQRKRRSRYGRRGGSACWTRVIDAVPSSQGQPSRRWQDLPSKTDAWSDCVLPFTIGAKSIMDAEDTRRWSTRKVRSDNITFKTSLWWW